MSPAWLTLLADLEDHRTGTALDNRALRHQLLAVATTQPDPQWSFLECWRGLTIEEATVGPWTLFRVKSRQGRSRVYPFTVPDCATEDLTLYPVRLWTSDVPHLNYEEAPVLFWPAEQPLASLVAAIERIPADHRYSLTAITRRLEAKLGVLVAEHPEQLETSDVLRVVLGSQGLPAHGAPTQLRRSL